MDIRQKMNLISVLKGALKIARETQVPTPCDTCINFSRLQDGKPYCVKFKDTIPDDVFPVGCDEYEYNDIPF